MQLWIWYPTLRKTTPHLRSRLGGDASAAKTLVNVVPTLAPKVNGYILSRDKTPMPTRGVNAEVNTEEDCNSVVISAPRAMLT